MTNKPSNEQIHPTSPSSALGEMVIKHPQFDDIVQSIERCERLTLRNPQDPVCLSLEAPPGAGKTTVLATYVEHFLSTETHTGLIVPNFYVETPSPTTVKGMASEMLKSIGDPGYDKGQMTSMNSRLVDYIQKCQVRVVLIDDFHHLIESETDKVLTKVSEWLKVLIKATHKPFIVAGIEGKVKRILDKNPQLSRLFGERKQITPFSWDTDASKKLLYTFLLLAQNQSGLTLPTDLPTGELLYRIHYGTKGIVGNIMNLLRYAADLAEKEKTRQITLEMLSVSYERRLHAHVKQAVNPFAISPNKNFRPPKDNNQ